MIRLFVCEECRAFQCTITDKRGQLDFDHYTLECPLKMKDYGFFVVDVKFHMFDKMGKFDDGTYAEVY